MVSLFKILAMQKISYLVLSLFLVSLSADAQSLLNRLKEKTQENANQRAGRKIDDGINKSLDGIENIFSRKSDSNPKASSAEPSSSGSDPNTNATTGSQASTEYSFEHRVTVEIKLYKGKKVEDKMNYVMLVPAKDDNYMGTEVNMESDGQQVNATMVFDIDKQSSVVLMNQAGMKIAMRQKMEYGNEDATAKENADFDYKKTGRSKEILGYLCYEYEFKYEGNYSLIWVTEELKLKSFLSSLAELSKNSQYATLGGPFKGYMMEMTSWDKGKNKGNKTEMRVTKIEMNTPTQVSTAGYTIMGG
jgi:hypothetical protein